MVAILAVLKVFATIHAVFAWVGSASLLAKGVGGVKAVASDMGKAIGVAFTVGSFLLNAALFLAPYVGGALAFGLTGFGTLLTFAGSLLAHQSGVTPKTPVKS